MITPCIAPIFRRPNERLKLLFHHGYPVSIQYMQHGLILGFILGVGRQLLNQHEVTIIWQREYARQRRMAPIEPPAVTNSRCHLAHVVWNDVRPRNIQQSLIVSEHLQLKWRASREDYRTVGTSGQHPITVTSYEDRLLQVFSDTSIAANVIPLMVIKVHDGFRDGGRPGNDEKRINHEKITYIWESGSEEDGSFVRSIRREDLHTAQAFIENGKPAV